MDVLALAFSAKIAKCRAVEQSSENVGAAGRRAPQTGQPFRAIDRQIAKRTVAGARTAGKKLSKEVLENFMFGFADLAEHFEPPPEVERPNPHADEFTQYAAAAFSACRISAAA